MEDEPNGRRPKWKSTKMEDDPKDNPKMIQMEDKNPEGKDNV